MLPQKVQERARDDASPAASRRRLSLVIARLNVGGPAVHVTLLAAGLKERGHAVELLTGRVSPTEGDMGYYAHERGVEPVFHEDLGRELSPIKDLALFFRFLRYFRETRPDVVHTHTAKAGAVARPAAWLAGVPVILHTFHGHVFRHYFGPLKSWIFLMIERILAALTTRIIVLGEEQKREIAELRIADPARISVVPLGLELEALARRPRRIGRLQARLGLAPDVRLVGIVARLVPVKCHDDFFRAAAAVYAQRQKIAFLVVGDGELREWAGARVRELGIEPVVHFLGWEKDMNEIYPELDILALTSRNEGLPTVIIEAMAAGVPVVSTRVGSVGDLIGTGEGFVVEPGDVEGIARGMVEILDDPENAAAMAAKGREKALGLYGSGRMVEDLDSLYRDLLEQKGKR